MSGLRAFLDHWGLRILRAMPSKDFRVFMPSREEQESRLARLLRSSGALTPARRSYLQYLCQKPATPWWKRSLLQIASAVALPPFILTCWVLSWRSARAGEATALFYHSNRKDLPMTLAREFHVEDYHGGLALTGRDLGFWLRRTAWPHVHDPYFALKVAYKLARYRGGVQPKIKAIIASAEYSFASSIATEWCRRQGIEHVNIQHGLKLFNIRDAFCLFDRFFVWDEFFIRLFGRLRVEALFVVERPPSLALTRTVEVPVGPKPVLKYYLQINSEEDLRHIAAHLRRLKDKLRVVVRPHPRYTDSRALNEIFAGLEIEPASTPIGDSILNADYVVSRYSSVLFQAAVSGVKVLVDDVSAPEDFRHLAELDCIFLEGEQSLLSRFIPA